MTKNEVAFIVAFLNELDDQFGNDGCNDMYLKDTPENRKLFTEAEKHWSIENEVEEDEIQSVEDAIQVPHYGRSKVPMIGTNNQTILSYLRDKLAKEYSVDKKDIPETSTW